MAEITSLTKLLKTKVGLQDYFVVANSTTKKARRLQVQAMFSTLTTKGTGGESLYSGVTNGNQLNFKGIKSGDATKFTVATTSDNLVLSLVEAGIDLNNCNNATSKFLKTVDLAKGTGTLAVNRGGLGLTTVTKGSILYGSALDTYSTLNMGAINGQLLIGNATTGIPTLATLASSDASITITNTAGAIDLTAASTSSLKTTLDCSVYNVNLNDAAGNSWLSGDGTAEGVHVDASGYVFIGDTLPTVPTLASSLTVGGTTTNAITIGNVSTYSARAIKFQDATGTNAGIAASVLGADASGTSQEGGALTLEAGSGTNTTRGGHTYVRGGGNSGTSGKGGDLYLQTFNSSDTATTAISIAGTTQAVAISNTTTLGSSAELIMGSGALKPGSGGLWRSTPVVLTDASTVNLTVGNNAGRTNVIQDVSAHTTINLPTPSANGGEYYHFIYGGAAADAQNAIIRTTTTDNSVYFKGGITHLDTNADNVAVYSNGSSNEQLTITTPQTIDIHCLALNATIWYIWGTACSVTAPAFAD